MRIRDKKTTPVADTMVKDIGGVRIATPDAEVRSLQVDKVDISVSAKELTRAHKLLDAMPDVRIDKVMSLKTVVQSGLYNVEAEKVVVKIIEKSIRDAIYVMGKA